MTAVTQVKESAHRRIARLGMGRAMVRARLRLLARKVQRRDELADDGYPVPPPVLLVGITSEATSADWYLESGRGDIEALERLLADHGVDAAALDSVLDFGCGCGRVARRWLRFPQVRVSGCDYDPKMVDWCRRNLPFIDVRRNGLEPPLPHEPDRFDFAYAFSVFTHLDADRQRPWLEEMGRVLKPGRGLLLFSALGPSHARDVMTADEGERFARGELIVKRPEISGEGACIALHPPQWVERTLSTVGFELLERFDESRPLRGSHDFYLARAPG
ncbi:MAG: class I SAM-dependent methyltransferase [Solirubrobacterales bacterium]